MVYAAGPGVVGLLDDARPLKGKQVTAFLLAVALTCTPRIILLRKQSVDGPHSSLCAL